MAKLIWILPVALYLSGCATVARGTKDKMVIDTEPPGAVVTTDKELGSSKKARAKDDSVLPHYYGCPATPCEFKVPRRAEFIMTISKAGYEDIELGIQSGLHKESLNANLAGSAASGIGLGLATGALAAGLSVSGGGIATGVAAASAGVATAGIAVVTIGVDAASGALLNLRPNPIFLTLPPKGTVIEPHPSVAIIRAERAKKARKKNAGKAGAVIPREKKSYEHFPRPK